MNTDNVLISQSLSREKRKLLEEILSQPDLFGTFGLSEFLDTEDIRYFDALDMFEKDGSIYVNCLIKNKPKVVKSPTITRPEEIIRQLYLVKLTKHYHYPLPNIDIERPVQFGRDISKRADIVVYRDGSHQQEYIVVEIKKPDVADGLGQLKGYANATGAPLLVLSDGKTSHYLERTDPNQFENLVDLPKYGQTTDDIRKEKLTFDELEPINDLHQIVTDMEDAILANAGVNAFDEIFKLIYAKLYDEIMTPKQDDRQFKTTSMSNQEHLDKVKGLFEKARNKWGEGVFKDFENIDIPANAIVPAISMLQKYKIYNGDFRVVDEAFEYLISSDSKGEKGQYFTPRFVIDMAVQMLNPRGDEYLIDTAAGSCGFPVHAMQYVWKNEITNEAFGDDFKEKQKEYARDYLYAIDFDPRTTKIAKAIMLIAGDGKTHVLNGNTLDPTGWSEEVRGHLNNRLTHFRDAVESSENQRKFSYFDFDILMTNPPFAGDVPSSLLHRYELGKKENGHIRNSLSRDILFIERNLNFLKPGGRMAIVLPQGVFNNTNMEYVRDYFMAKARILAVVGLHGNTFKPHTGTKTSVLFLQKWGGEAGEPKADYPIFMAVSKLGGKNNSGEYVYKKNEDGGFDLDDMGNRVFDTDLFEIAKGFVDWGKEQRLNFLK